MSIIAAACGISAFVALMANIAGTRRTRLYGVDDFYLTDALYEHMSKGEQR